MAVSHYQPQKKVFAPPALRVLVADHDVVAADRLALLLRAEGYRASVCYDGPTALLMARACKPGVVLLDLGLPGLSGQEVALRLRQGAFPPPLLLALASTGGEEERRLARDAGFDALLDRPADPDQFLALLAKCRPAARRGIAA